MNCRRSILFFISFAFLAILSFFYVDYPLSRWIYDNQNQKWSLFFEIVTISGEKIYVLLLIVTFFLVGWILKIKKSYKTIGLLFQKQAVIIIISLAVSSFIVYILKYSLGRFRPIFFIEQGLGGFDPFNFGFKFASLPSGHTQTVFVVATCLALFYPRYKLLFFLLAILGATSRVVLLLHYPSDVIVGAYIGISCTLCLHNYLYLRLNSFFRKRKSKI